MLLSLGRVCVFGAPSALLTRFCLARQSLHTVRVLNKEVNLVRPLL